MYNVIWASLKNYNISMLDKGRYARRCNRLFSKNTFKNKCILPRCGRAAYLAFAGLCADPAARHIAAGGETGAGLPQKRREPDGATGLIESFIDRLASEAKAVSLKPPRASAGTYTAGGF
jgi:hypothetical protein